MWTWWASTGARRSRRCGACSGPARRCRAISTPRRCSRHPPSSRVQPQPWWPRPAARPATSSTSGTASGRTPIRMRWRGSWTSCMSTPSDFAATAAGFFRDLQGRFCAAFEAFEPASRFEARSWKKPDGHRLEGGGESRLMRGAVFEKVGVNVSHVWGVLAPEARGQVAGAKESDGHFVACGISLVAHMANPYVPAMHMNLRYLWTSRAWFGGGAEDRKSVV